MKSAVECEVCGDFTAAAHGVCQRTHACRVRAQFKRHRSMYPPLAVHECSVCGNPTRSKYKICVKSEGCRAANKKARNRLLARTEQKERKQEAQAMKCVRFDFKAWPSKMGGKWMSSNVALPTAMNYASRAMMLNYGEIRILGYDADGNSRTVFEWRQEDGR